MSHTQPTAASSSSSSPLSPSSNFQLIIVDALSTYKKRTKEDPCTHPLAAQIQTCDSPSAILAVLRQQIQSQGQSCSTDQRWTKWLDPTINVLYAFSDILGAHVSLVFSPASVVFAGFGILLSAAKGVRASPETLVDIFERVEMFFRRVQIYTEVQPTAEMMNIIIYIMAEVLSILGIATKEIKQGRIKKFVKRVIGRTDIEDALKRLDKLSHEEAWMGIAQNLKASHTVGKGVKEVKVVMQQTTACVDQVKVVTQQTAADVDKMKVATQQTATGVDQMQRNQLRENIHKWLTPPDPSTNHNIACGTYLKKTASWFFQGSIFQEWKSTGSLLWIDGKPGSGKSVLCSTVIQDIEDMCKAGNGSMAYFYFDFRDANKQGLRDVVSSLLTQLSSSSAHRCDILSNLYLAHDKGKKQPSDAVLAGCLKKMLTLPDQPPTYLIMDAFDECPNTPGIPSPRERVLHLLKELAELHLPDLHICITSRPEIDIRDVLEPLTSSRRVSLHDESGQKQDIVDYVKSIVYSDSEPFMKRWRTEDKELVIKVLSERADGMFRWVFCQLETLRYCLPPSVRHTLDELPETLDGTYERVLKEIKKPNRMHALRLMQCLVVAIRPLKVQELAEVLAVDFDDEGIPKLNPNWRWGDEEQALLSSCSSLIAIVEADGSRIVQFSHFSVIEFMTSTRLATSSGNISHYHIDLEPAHTVLAQACMGVLLRLDDRVKESGFGNSSPLAGYAAEHWVAHARHENVSLWIQKAMEYLFDADKPYFAAWLKLHDIDSNTNSLPGSFFRMLTPYSKSGATPLYYAARCGFQDLVEHLVANDPMQLNATGGYYLTPLVVALAAGHFQIANFLHDNGADPNVRGHAERTPLHCAASHGDFEMVRVLLKYKADVNARFFDGKTPLHFVSEAFSNESPNKAFDIARLLLKRGADINAQKDDHSTPLHLVVDYGPVTGIRVLLEHGADVNARKNDGTTPLHIAADCGTVEGIRVLLEHGANVNARMNDDTTPLHLAVPEFGAVELMRVLLDNGADVNAQTNYGITPLHLASEQHRTAEHIRVLLENGADVNARMDDDSTPLHKAVLYRSVEDIRVLLEHGADVNARKNDDITPLYEAVQCHRMGEHMRVLLEHGADANAQTKDGITSLHVAAQEGTVEDIRVLLKHGANANARTKDGVTSLHAAAAGGTVENIRVLLEHGANVNARTNDGIAPLHLAAADGTVENIRVLLEHGADVAAEFGDGQTALHISRDDEIKKLLSKYGAVLLGA